MADEVIKRDRNHATVLAGITNDVNQYITMLRVDPDTKRLLVSATGSAPSSALPIGTPVSNGGLPDLFLYTDSTANVYQDLDAFRDSVTNDTLIGKTMVTNISSFLDVGDNTGLGIEHAAVGYFDDAHGSSAVNGTGDAALFGNTGAMFFAFADDGANASAILVGNNDGIISIVSEDNGTGDVAEVTTDIITGAIMAFSLSGGASKFFITGPTGIGWGTGGVGSFTLPTSSPSAGQALMSTAGGYGEIAWGNPTAATITGTPTRIMYFNNAGSQSTDALFTRNSVTNVTTISLTGDSDVALGNIADRAYLSAESNVNGTVTLATLVGILGVGDIVTGSTSGTTGEVTEVDGTSYAFTDLTGSFTNGENWTSDSPASGTVSTVTTFTASQVIARENGRSLMNSVGLNGRIAYFDASPAAERVFAHFSDDNDSTYSELRLAPQSAKIAYTSGSNTQSFETTNTTVGANFSDVISNTSSTATWNITKAEISYANNTGLAIVQGNEDKTFMRHRDATIIRLTVSSVTGAFTYGEQVNGATASGFVADQTATTLTLTGVSGTFALTETITGASSGETAIVDARVSPYVELNINGVTAKIYGETEGVQMLTVAGSTPLTAFGWNTGTTDSDNSWFGANAGFGATQGSNVGIGNYAFSVQYPFEYLPTLNGVRNTAVGTLAGFGNGGGDDNVYLGYETRNLGEYNESIAIGRDAAINADNQLRVGGPGYGISDVVIGAGDLGGTCLDITIRGGRADGANVAGTDINFQAGIGTGTGGSGDLLFWTAPAAASSSTLNTATKVFSLDLNGNVRAFTLHNNATAQGSATNQDIRSGTYTPTRSAENNLDGNVTPTQAQWSRVGNVVTVSGRVTAVDPTAGGAASFELSLPVASNIGAVEDVAGVAFSGAIAGQGGEVTGSVANNTAVISWIAVDTTSQSWSYTFTYEVI